MSSVMTAPEILPTLAVRTLVADAIHEGVCAATETDGERLCAIYAATTMAVMMRLTGERYILQGGMLSIQLSEAYRAQYPRGATHYTMDGRPPSRGAPSRAADPLPEFHAWCGRIHEPRYEGHEAAAASSALCELIDISARHYPALVQTIDTNWPGPEDFTGRTLWTTGDRLPDGLILIPDRETTYTIASRVTTEPLLGIIRRAAALATALLRAQGIATLQPRTNEPPF